MKRMRWLRLFANVIAWAFRGTRRAIGAGFMFANWFGARWDDRNPFCQRTLRDVLAQTIALGIETAHRKMRTA